MITNAWLQKHPTPAAGDGEFHWYPAEGDGALRAELVERMAGVAAPAVLWQLAPGRVVWAQTFEATAPRDGRRYTGLVVSVIETAAGEPAALLAELVVPAAAPLSEPRAVPAADREPAIDGAGGVDRAAIARTLISGGSAAIGNLRGAALPAVIAQLERVLPPCVTARARRGTWIAGTPVRPRVRDRVVELAVAAVDAPGSRAARAWQLLGELATAEHGIDAVAAALDDEQTRGDWLGAVHAWGRGHGGARASELADRLALRVLDCLMTDRDPRAALAEARWHALLPAARRAELLAAIARRGSTLRALVEARHA